MGSRSIALVAACTLLSCSYPEFEFAAADAAIDSGGASDTASSDTASSDTASSDTASSDTAPDDSSLDTTVDSVAVDTAAPVDTMPDALLGFCASFAHFFCNDFDSSSSEPTFGWSSFDLSGSGAFKLDTTAKSAPRSLRTSLTAPSPSTFDAAAVNRSINAPAADSLTRFEADIMLETANYAGVQGTLLLKMQRAGGNGIGVGIDPDGLYVELVGASYHWLQLPTKVTAGKWFHLRVEGKLLVAGGFAKVWVDGVLAADITGKSTAVAEGVSRTFVVGLYADAPIATFVARFDNATVDFP